MRHSTIDLISYTGERAMIAERAQAGAYAADRIERAEYADAHGLTLREVVESSPECEQAIERATRAMGFWQDAYAAVGGES